MARPYLFGVLAVFLSFFLAANAIVTTQMGVLPAGWSVAGPANASVPLTLHIFLEYSNLDQLDSKLMDAATPGSAGYGQWLDKDSVDQIFAPSPAASSTVMSWLRSQNISHAQSDGHSITVKTNVRAANALLNTSYTNYVSKDGRHAVRTPSYSLSDDVAQFIELIEPSIYIGNVKSHARFGDRLGSAASNPSYHPNCSHVITPLCLREMYGINGYHPNAVSGSSVGVGALLGDYASSSDLLSFQKKLGLPHTTLNVVSINGGQAGPTSDASFESDMDTQYASGTAWSLPTTEFIVDGSDRAVADAREAPPGDYNEPWLVYLRQLLSLTNAQLPKVISNSFGDDEQTVPRAFAHRVCNMIGLLGLRGITVINSSGDNGAGAICLANDGSNATRFTPEFPSSCPYVTSVGGTQGYPFEEAWGSGGGGFSNTFASPSYQKSAVQDYLASLDSSAKSYITPFANFSGRAYPDVSAHADLPYLLVYNQGDITSGGGTSAAAPVFAGIVALLNDARLRAGKPTMGFLNPWLYSIGKDGLKDIIKGASTGCKSGTKEQQVKWVSWNATNGWDPATGWGTPNMEKMKELALKC